MKSSKKKRLPKKKVETSLPSKKARSIPQKRFFKRCYLSYIFQTCFLASIIVNLYHLYYYRDIQTAIITLVFILGWALVKIILYFEAAKAKCPLCLSSPFRESSASTHAHAQKVFPFNYAQSNFMRFFFTLRFRCQFCGELFDLCKKTR